MEAIDCASTLTQTAAIALKNTGIVAVGRYLGKKNTTWWKAMGAGELKIIFNAGLAVFLIWEGNPTFAGYFNYAKGVSDAALALDEAAYLGAPGGTAIYFTVDYDAQPGDMAAIAEYFRGVRDRLKGQYLVGAYGSYSVMTALSAAAGPPDRYYQTYAWSRGQVYAGNHIYQYQNDITLGGVAVDRNKIEYKAGTWPELEGEDVLKHAILLNSADDFWAGSEIARKLGVGIFFRLSDKSAPAEAKTAEHLITVGGAKIGHKNETLLSGTDKFDTAAAVKKYLSTL